MKNKKAIFALITSLGLISANKSNACTGITLKSKQDGIVLARTIEWSGSEMDNMYVIVPRNHSQSSLLPDGTSDGLSFTSLYGFTGLAVMQPEMIVDGTNEAGLSAALFYFPDYGQYQEYNPADKAKSISDLQLVPWILSKFSTIAQVKNAIKDVRVINIDPRASTVHWRITEPSGRQVVLEFEDGQPKFYENKLGVLTNSPGFKWQTENLNNYVNLYPGTAAPTDLGGIELRAFGAGSGFLGLPGDLTPPSRFVRAAFFQTYSIQPETTYDAIKQAFHILNNFDLPLGTMFPKNQAPVNMPSATQWTIATDTQNRIIYYTTMYNRALRAINYGDIDYENITYQYHPLDENKQETIIPVKID